MPLRGSVVYLYIFDIGSEVATSGLGPEFVRPNAPPGAPHKPALPKDVALPRPVSAPPPAAVDIFGQPGQVEVRIYDIGVIAIAVEAPFDSDLAALRKFHQPDAGEGPPLDPRMAELCRDVVQRLGDAVRKPSPPGEPEAYTVFCLGSLDGELDAPRWLDAHSREVAELLNDVGPGGLSESQIAESLRHRQSYSPADLAVIDWDAALVVDLAGRPDDVLAVLELANLQLLELRVLDAVLDRHLGRAYEHLGHRTGLWLGRWTPVLHELRQHRVDAAQLADAISNITKFVGDWYLARVYLSARERFHLEVWRASVEARLGQLDRTYGLIHADVSDRRMFILELLITIFVGFEVVSTLLRW